MTTIVSPTRGPTSAPTLDLSSAPEPSSRPGPTRAVPWAWLRLAALLTVAALSELVYVAFWPITYYLTQAVDYTYEYLLQYPAVWERLLPLLLRFEATWPTGATSLEFMVDTFVRAFVAAFVLYLIAFFLARAGLPRGWGAAAVVGPAVAFQTTLFLMPGLFTTDLFSYVMYGQIAGPYDLNPYIHLPAYFPQNRMFHWIHPVWHYAPAIYGPAWIELSVLVGRAVAGWTDVDKVLAYKLVVNLAHLAGIGLLALAVHRFRPGAVLPSVVLYAWNPLILFEYGGNGHNDAVMVTIMLLAVVLFRPRWWLLGLAALVVSFLIKMSTFLLLPYYVIARARQERSPLRWVMVFGLSGLTVLAIVVGLYLRWWVGLETIGPILNWTQGPMYNNYVPDILAQHLAARYLLDQAESDPTLALERARAQVKLVTRALFAGYCLWELARVRGGLGLAGAGARIMLGFLLIANTWVLPWYFTWPFALAAVVGWEAISTRVLVGFSLSAPTVLYYHHFWHPYMSDWTYLLYLLPLAIAPLAFVPRLVTRLAARAGRVAPTRQTLRSYGSADADV